MRLLYVTSIKLPSKYANRIQTVSMAREFGKKLKGDFTLGGKRLQLGTGDEFMAYSFGSVRNGVVLAFSYLRFIKGHHVTHLYSREGTLLFLILIINRLFFWLKLHTTMEVHEIHGKKRAIHRYTHRRVNKCIVITSFLKEWLLREGVDPKRILVAPDGVDLALFDIALDKEGARRLWSLPVGRKIVAYVGSFFRYEWKGVDVLLKSAELLDQGILLVLMGASQEEEKYVAAHFQSPNIVILPQSDHNKVPSFLKAADVLALPNKSGDIVSERFTSPMKLFEYMGSRRPIIASDLPSIREVLHDNENALLVSPNDPFTLANGIESILSDPEKGTRLANRAFADVHEYTWAKRAEKILNFISE